MTAPARRRVQRQTVVVVAASSLIAGVLAVAPSPVQAAQADPAWRPKVPKTHSTPSTVQQPKKWSLPSTQKSVPRSARALPAAGSASVTLAATAHSHRSPMTRAGTLPVAVSADQLSAPTSVAVAVQSPSLAQRAHVNGMLLTVSRSQASTAPLSVQLSYASFANAGGAGFGQRLTLKQMPTCALTTPEVAACQVQTPIATTNRTAAQTLSATLAPAAPASSATPRSKPGQLAATAGSKAVVAAVAGPSGPSTDFTATSLSPSGTWTAGGATGGFSWNYPITVPPAAAGPTPSVALSYSSLSVDGHVASTNNQPSWVGEGWDYSPGFIERTFRSCADTTSLKSTKGAGEQCWAGDILSYSLNGSSNTIVRDDTDPNIYRLKNDDGSRVELIGAGTGAFQNEYWKVTTTDGTQYFFGKQTLPGGRTTSSTWTTQVCGDADSACTPNASTNVIAPMQKQAYRWNLDYVVDTHSNATGYFYAAETGYYGQMNATTPKDYIRGGYLTQIDYGMRATTTNLSTPSDRVLFTVAERCMSSCTTFDTAHAASWPDTPVDQNCASSGTCNTHSPTFWTRKRLTQIDTQYYSGTGTTFYLVDQYKLTQSFPNTGDPELEFDGIQRTGYAAGTATTATTGGTMLPKIAFTYTLLDNRVDGYLAQSAMKMWRLQQIVTETGQSIIVSYDQVGRAPVQCKSDSVPTAPESNTRECFPVYWTPLGYSTPQRDWFHTHLVTEVDVNDNNGTSPNRYTTYSYVGGAAWHYDDNEVAKPANRSWGQNRGYATVEVRTGNPNHASNGVADAWTLSTSLFYRGMEGDKLPGNTTRDDIKVVDHHGGSEHDIDEFAGTVRESRTFLGDTTTEVTATVTTPTLTATTATRNRSGLTALNARMLGTAVTTTYTDLAAGGTRQTTSTYGYDSIGRVVHQTDSGTDVADLCTTTRYADNTSSWIRNAATEVTKSAQSCPSGSTAPSNVLSSVRTYYDTSNTLGTVGNLGDPTRTDTLTGGSHWATGTSTFDTLGRQLSATTTAAAGDNRTTSTAYTPATAGPVTAQTYTNAKNQAASFTIDPSRGSLLSTTDISSLKTDATYDALGRLTAVWKPGQVKGTDTATVTYAYQLSQTLPPVVTTKTLVDPGRSQATNIVTSTSIYDAFGAPRQTQTDAPGGGRNVTDTFADGHGWVTASNVRWHTTGTPTTAVITASQTGVDDSVQTRYDGAGRVTTSTEYQGTAARRVTATAYSGDAVTVTPPPGGVQTTTRTDARGNTTELDQWLTPPTISASGFLSGGTARKTRYGFDALGQQTSITTPYGDLNAATWSSTYDLAGRVTQATDPDTGTTTKTYNDADEPTVVTDAAGANLNYTYDALGRKTGEYTGTSPSASTKLADWAYDTIKPGQGTTSTRYTTDHGNYTRKVTAYDTYGNPTSSELDLSAPDSGFAAQYLTTQIWSKTHLLNAVKLPGGTGNGGLASETVGFSYDGFGNVISTSGNNAYVSESVYSAYNEPMQYTLGVNNQKGSLTYTRDPMTRQLTSTHLSVMATTPQVEHLDYTYDAVGNLTKSIDAQGAAGDPTETNCYRYDQLSQLTEAWSATDSCAADPDQVATGTQDPLATIGGAQPYWLSWTLDNTGGRASQTRHATTPAAQGSAATATTTYATNVADHAHAISRTTTSVAGSPSSTTNYAYDAVGNTTSRTSSDGQSLTFTYNEESRTKTVTAVGGTSAGATSYDYDADGTQVFRRDPGSTTLFLGYQDVIRDTSTGVSTGNRSYTINGTVVGKREATKSPMFALTDAHGTNSVLVDTSSVPGQPGTPTFDVTRRHFDPYGNALVDSNGAAVVGARTTWLDSRTYLDKPATTNGLVDVGARSFDGLTGRFLSVDPILVADDPQSLNGYGYVDNDPVNASDPSGLRLSADSGGGTEPSLFGIAGTYASMTDFANSHRGGSAPDMCNGGRRACSGGTPSGSLPAPKASAPQVSNSSTKTPPQLQPMTHLVCDSNYHCRYEQNFDSSYMGDSHVDAQGHEIYATEMAGGLISRLPSGGDYPFLPKKGQRTSNPRSITRKSGYPEDKYGDVWQWDPEKGEWDVQHKGGGHTNVGPDGRITHKGNNSGRQTAGSGDAEDGSANSVSVPSIPPGFSSTLATYGGVGILILLGYSLSPEGG